MVWDERGAPLREEAPADRVNLREWAERNAIWLFYALLVLALPYLLTCIGIALIFINGASGAGCGG